MESCFIVPLPDMHASGSVVGEHHRCCSGSSSLSSISLHTQKKKRETQHAQLSEGECESAR